MSSITIKDNNEPLVDIKKTCPELVVKFSRQTIKGEKNLYLRKTVTKMVCQARKYLPEGMTFVIGDAWRPPGVQEAVFNNFIKRAKEKYPSWSQNKVIRMVKKFVAPSQGKFASGHMTGGAVDLRLWQNGRKVAMNSSKLTYSENAQTQQSKLPQFLQKNRRIMIQALKKTGLSNYSKEFWHWSYGDIQWAQRESKKKAFYGVVDKST